MPQIELWRAGERARFLPTGSNLIYLQRERSSQDFWLLGIATMERRPLTRLAPSATIRSFDITPDGEQIVFDRWRSMLRALHLLQGSKLSVHSDRGMLLG